MLQLSARFCAAAGMLSAAAAASPRANQCLQPGRPMFSSRKRVMSLTTMWNVREIAVPARPGRTYHRSFAHFEAGFGDRIPAQCLIERAIGATIFPDDRRQ